LNSTSDFLWQFLIQFLADLTLALLLAGLAIAIASTSWRRDIHYFFGVQRPRRGAITVKLSCMNVLPHGCTGADVVTEGFVGPAMSELEYRFALRLAHSVQTKPIARALRALRDVPGSSIDEPIVCDIRMSEQCPSDAPVDFSSTTELMERVKSGLRGGTYILVGDPTYNAATGYVLTNSSSRFRFVHGLPSDERRRRTVRIENVYHDAGSGVSEEHERSREPDGSNVEYAILERIMDWDGGIVFICAGTSTSATIAALRELTHWRELAHRFDRHRGRQLSGHARKSNFGILYQVRTANVEDVPAQTDVVERWQYPPPGFRAEE